MYSIDINFLKDRDLDADSAKGGLSFKKPTIDRDTNAPIVAGAAVLVLLPAIALLSSWWIGVQQTKVKDDIQEIEGQIQVVEAKKAKIQQIKEKLAKAEEDNNALAAVFEQIKPWSALLQDITDQTPAGVQIQSIEQSETQEQEGSPKDTVVLNIEGYARSHNDVNDFLLTLQRSELFDQEKTLITQAGLVDNPAKVNVVESLDNREAKVTVKLPQVVSFTIKSTLTDKSAYELLRVLERKGAVGLVSRIKTLEQRGLIKR